MSRAVFLLLLASCVTMGLGLQCYQCASDLSVVMDGLGSLPFISNDCNSASFNPDGMDTVTVSDSTDSASFLQPAYCFTMVLSLEDVVGVTLRGGLSSSALSLPTGLSSRGNSSSSSSSSRNTFSVDSLTFIQELLSNVQVPISDVDISMCSSDTCNSVSGLGSSVSVLAMSAVFLMATLTNAFY